MSKLQDLIEIEGFDTLDDFLVEYALDSTVPGICMNPDCDYTTHYEPDQDSGWCELCDTNTVKSGLLLAGIL